MMSRVVAGMRPGAEIYVRGQIAACHLGAIVEDYLEKRGARASATLLARSLAPSRSVYTWRNVEQERVHTRTQHGTPFFTTVLPLLLASLGTCAYTVGLAPLE